MRTTSPGRTHCVRSSRPLNNSAYEASRAGGQRKAGNAVCKSLTRRLAGLPMTTSWRAVTAASFAHGHKAVVIIFCPLLLAGIHFKAKRAQLFNHLVRAEMVMEIELLELLQCRAG